MTFSADPEQVIPWVVRAIHNVLEAASRHYDIQRVVLTSSAIAAVFPEPNKEGIVVREGEIAFSMKKEEKNASTNTGSRLLE